MPSLDWDRRLAAKVTKCGEVSVGGFLREVGSDLYYLLLISHEIYLLLGNLANPLVSHSMTGDAPAKVALAAHWHFLCSGSSNGPGPLSTPSFAPDVCVCVLVEFTRASRCSSSSSSADSYFGGSLSAGLFWVSPHRPPPLVHIVTQAAREPLPRPYDGLRGPSPVVSSAPVTAKARVKQGACKVYATLHRACGLPATHFRTPGTQVVHDS